MVKETIEKLKGIIAQSDTGHLPLSCRIELMKQVGDVLTVQKIMCECWGHLPLSCRIELMKQVGDVLTVQKIMCECCKKACSGESTFAEDGHTLPCGQRP